MDQPHSPAAASPSSLGTVDTTICAAVILQRYLDTGKKWGQPQWSIYSIVVDNAARTPAAPMVVHEKDGCTRYLYSGLTLRLHKDSCEGYWYNLLSDEPRVFVVCDGEYGDDDISIAFITANQDIATGCMESERVVLSIQMPEQMCEQIERYVVTHYRPVARKKRKRRDWVTESDYAQRH